MILSKHEKSEEPKKKELSLVRYLGTYINNTHVSFLICLEGLDFYIKTDHMCVLALAIEWINLQKQKITDAAAEIRVSNIVVQLE